ncbi:MULTISPECIES: hypothetical protein [Halorubrum]|uniref:hypothetical protein n=1 Tax=Halorubrum TaxID=56688 RepID=UPI00135F1448|nr:MULTISPECIES: hypothetical protein [Halorubrum]
MGSNQRSSRKKAVQIGRRSFLATTATLAGTSVTVVEASDEAVDRFSLGKRGFIETSVTHKGAPDYPRSQGHRYVADYIIEDSLLSLINFPLKQSKIIKLSSPPEKNTINWEALILIPPLKNH